MVNNENALITVLSVGPSDEHHRELANLFSGLNQDPDSDLGWRLESRSNLHAALPILRQGKVPILLCDADCPQVRWKQMLERVLSLPDPPFVIATSRVADNRLWAEALNLGAYDVLAKPYDSEEVERVVSLAWQRWAEQHGIPTPAEAGKAVAFAG